MHATYKHSFEGPSRKVEVEAVEIRKLSQLFAAFNNISFYSSKTFFFRVEEVDYNCLSNSKVGLLEEAMKKS